MFSKFFIIEMIVEPSLMTDDYISYYEKFDLMNRVLLRNAPKNSVIAKPLSTNKDILNLDQQFCYILAPFFPPHIALPCKPGEMVWTYFDDTNKSDNFGYWICRVSTLNYIEDLNYTHFPRIKDNALPFIDLNNVNTGSEPIFAHSFNNTLLEYNKETKQINSNNKFTFIEQNFIRKLKKNIKDPNNLNPFDFILKETFASKLMDYEAVPSFLKKPGDVVLEGSNNNLIVLGTEKPYSRLLNSGIFGIVPPERLTKRTDINTGNIDLITGINNTKYPIQKTINQFQRVEKHKFPLNTNKNYYKSGIQDLTSVPTFNNTKSRFYISQNTIPDVMLDIVDVDPRYKISDKREELPYDTKLPFHFELISGLTLYNEKILGKTNITDERAAIIQKSDTIRLLGRKDIQIIIVPEDSSGNSSEDITGYASITIKQNGEIILKPADNSLLKLGGEDADKVPLCTNLYSIVDATNKFEQKTIFAEPIETDGGQLVGEGLYKGEHTVQGTKLSGSLARNDNTIDKKQEIINPKSGIFASRVLIK